MDIFARRSVGVQHCRSILLQELVEWGTVADKPNDSRGLRLDEDKHELSQRGL